MNFKPNHIYHLYNQGNNRELIFFHRENYIYFLKKIKQQISPFADILAWCLMPNHFHLLIVVAPSDRVTSSHPVTKEADGTLNNSIAIMLRSYTRAINKQQNRSGSLFREGTKAEEFGTIENERIKLINRKSRETIQQGNNEDYLQSCFHYIHENPVKAGVIVRNTDWEFSSAKDVARLRDGKLINRELIEELGLMLQS